MDEPVAAVPARGANPFREAAPVFGAPPVISASPPGRPFAIETRDDDSEDAGPLGAVRAFVRFAFLLYWPPSTFARFLHLGFYFVFCVSSAFSISFFMLSAWSEFLVILVLAFICYSPTYLLFWLPATYLAWADRSRRQARL